MHAYTSCALTSREQKYAQIEKELLSAQFTMDCFHQYTYRRDVIVQNDHKPLETIDCKAIVKAPGRLQRVLLLLMNYNYRIVHVPGTEMYLADALSRDYLTEEKAEEAIFD